MNWREIATEVAERNGVTLADLQSRSRARRASHPRQEAYAELYATGRFSTTQIGRWLGNRDHSTVVQGIKTYRERNP